MVRVGFRGDLCVESLRMKRYFPGKYIPKRDETTREYYWNHNSNTKSKHFFLIYLLIMLLQLSHFCPFTPLHPAHPPPSHIPPLQFMSMGHTYKFFGFYISYTILTLPLSIFHLSVKLFILCTFTPPSPIDNPPCDLHFCGSVSVLVVCLVFFCFGFRCGC